MVRNDNIVENQKKSYTKIIIYAAFINMIFTYPIGLALGFNPLNGLGIINAVMIATIVFLFVGGIIRNIVGSNSGQIIGFFYGNIFGCLLGGLFGYISSMISGYLFSEFVIFLAYFNIFDLNIVYNQSNIGFFDVSGIYSQNTFRNFILVGGTFSGGIVGLIRGSYDGLMAGKNNENSNECCHSEDVFINKGNDFFKIGSYEEAIDCYDKVLEINPQYEALWFNKGSASFKLDRYEEAIECYNKAIEINPQYESAWAAKGGASFQLDHYEDAIECYNKLIEINPQAEGAWFNKSIVLAELCRYEEEIECFNRIIEINPKYENAWAAKGRRLYFQGCHEEAIECCYKALEINSQNELAKNIKSLVEMPGKLLFDKVDVKINVPTPLKVGIETPLKITVNNPTKTPIYNIQIRVNPSKFLKYDEMTAEIDEVPAESSKYTAIFITPRISDEIDFKSLTISCKINGCNYEKEPISIGTYEAVDANSHKLATYTDDITSDLSISRETEFYQGFIRFKMSVTNTSPLVVNDVALDFYFDDKLLRMDTEERDHQVKNGKIILGNIASNSSTSVTVYFDPMMCSKGTDINCQIIYKDAKGQLQTTQMEPKKISVVCPIIETDSDINIGRLKEFIEILPHSDSKVYQIQTDFSIDVLKNISQEVIQKHDVKHIRTLSTKDRNTCEIWYYGKTKVHSHDIVIKITISSETQSVELFAATQTTESLVGLLAEFGRELKSSIQNNIAGNVQQVINLSIIDSIVQRSNLLSYCDINGNCSGNVVIDDSYIRRSNLNNNLELNQENKEGVKEMDMLDIYNHLVSRVKNSSNVKDIKIDYKEVWTYFNQDIKMMLPLFNMLNQICNKCRDENKPLLSAIVVNEKTGIPGPGFFKNCMKDMDLDVLSNESQIKKIHEDELKKVYDYWHKNNKN